MAYSIKTLLFSDDRALAGVIKNALNAGNFNIQIPDSPEKFAAGLKGVRLVVLHIAAKNTADIASIKNELKSKGKTDIAKIALLDFSCADLLFENGIKFDDFCFISNIRKELAIRVKAVLIRRGIYPPVNAIIVNGLVLNPDKYELTVNDAPIELTFKEFELLKLLLKNRDRVFTRKKLLSLVWEYDFYGGSRTVDVHIRRLRSKIPPPYSLMLKTIRNVGYMFSPGNSSSDKF
jgi:DNA-binding response OmpR family regulator